MILSTSCPLRSVAFSPACLEVAEDASDLLVVLLEKDDGVARHGVASVVGLVAGAVAPGAPHEYPEPRPLNARTCPPPTATYISLDLCECRLKRSRDLRRSQHLGAVARAVEDGAHDGSPVKVVVASAPTPTDVADLWDSAHRPERLARWFAPVSGDLEVGGRFQVEGNAGGEVLACDAAEAPRGHLGVRRRASVGRRHTSTADADGDHARPAPHGRRRGNEHWDSSARAPSASVGARPAWASREHLATGTARPAEEVEAWSASPEGQALMTGASDRVGRGRRRRRRRPRSLARRRAAHAAFYTGAEPPA